MVNIISKRNDLYLFNVLITIRHNLTANYVLNYNSNKQRVYRNYCKKIKLE